MSGVATWVVHWLPVALLGAVCGLDVVSFPQAMVSRPIVAATAAGALAGHVGAGLLVGVVIELIALETLPVGASRYPEWGSASVVAGTLAAGMAGRPAGSVPLAVLGGLATAWVGGWSMIALRRWNAARARAHVQAVDSGVASTVVGLQLWGLTADLLRAAVLTLVALLVLEPLTATAALHWGIDHMASRGMVVGIAAAVAVAAVWKVFHSTSATRWLFCGGLAVGVALLVWS